MEICLQELLLKLFKWYDDDFLMLSQISNNICNVLLVIKKRKKINKRLCFWHMLIWCEQAKKEEDKEIGYEIGYSLMHLALCSVIVAGIVFC